MARTPDLAAAERFVLLTARLLDRLRYRYLFHDGDREPVVAALAPYQNPDGGYGQALEPDNRDDASQPVTVHSALQVLDEIGAFGGPLVSRALDYLGSATAPDGGVPVAAADIPAELKAPWWVVADERSGSLLPTAGIAGLLLKHRYQHPWLAGAIDFCWRAIDAIEQTHPYEVEYCLAFLDHAPDRGRAEAAAERLGRIVRDQQLVLVDPDLRASQGVPPGYAPGEHHTPVDYAPLPTSLARRWFSDREIAVALDALVADQRDDGGWMPTWRDWNPTTTLEWRGVVTIRALIVLRAYGRLG